LRSADQQAVIVLSLALSLSMFLLLVVMLDRPCSNIECKTTGYPLHSPLSPSLPLLCITMCHQVSTELYFTIFCWDDSNAIGDCVVDEKQLSRVINVLFFQVV